MAREIARIIFPALLCIGVAFSPDCGKRAEVFKIAVILPFTGPEARAAKEHLNGIILAVEERNAAAAGVTYEIISDNDQNSPAAARDAFRRELLEKKINIAFVVTRTGAMAIAADADREFIPLFANVSHPLMTIMHFYSFRNFPSAALEIKRMTGFAARSLTVGSIAVLTSDDDYGRDAIAAIEEGCRANGITVAAKASFGEPETDAAAAEAILAERPEAVYVFGRGAAAARVIGALRTMRYQGIILGSSDLPRALAENRDGDALEGVYCPMTSYELAGNAAFADSYRKRFNAEATLNAAVEYDAVGIIAKAVEIMGREELSLSNALKKVGHTRGVLGECEYVDREWLPPLGIVQIRGGEAVPL